MTATRLILMLLRIGAGVQVVLGIGFWTGHWVTLVDLHRTVGIVFVILLWTIGMLALVRRSNALLALLAMAWSLVIAGVGFAQQSILPGDAHWIVRVAHLVIGLAAMPMAERLARRDAPAA